MLLIHYLRDEVGLPMRGFHVGKHVGYTTDAEKATRASAAGAQATKCGGRIESWEIACLPEQEAHA